MPIGMQKPGGRLVAVDREKGAKMKIRLSFPIWVANDILGAV
jgi:hypothetical protein